MNLSTLHFAKHNNKLNNSTQYCLRRWLASLIIAVGALACSSLVVANVDPKANPQDEEDCCCGCPDEECCEGPACSSDPVNYKTGASIEQNIDLFVPGPAVDFQVKRSYDSTLTGTTALGNNWSINLSDKFLVKNGSDIEFVRNASSKRTFTASGGGFLSPDDSTLRLEHDSVNDEYVITDIRKNLRLTFHDFTISDTLLQGKIKEGSTLQWHAEGKSGNEYSYNTSTGNLTQITTSEGQDYTIEITYSGDNISKVEVKDGADVLQKVEYTYYGDVTSPSTNIGTSGDLVQVKVSRKASADTASFSIVNYTQYRYSSSRLKAVYNNSAVNSIIDGLSGVTTAEDILQKADTYGTPQVSSFATKSFVYYSSNQSTYKVDTDFEEDERLQTTYGGTGFNETGMVKSETIGGGCSACGSAAGLKKTYYYMSLYQGATLDQNEVTRIVIEDTVDANGNAAYRKIFGLNDSGWTLREVLIDDPVGSPQYWCKSTVMSTSGKEHRKSEERNPSAHTIVDTATELKNFLDPYDSEGNSWSNDQNTLNSSDGLINTYEYNSDGQKTGHKVKKGRTGTAYYVSAYDYGDGDGDSTGRDYDDNALVIATYNYPTKTTNQW